MKESGGACLQYPKTRGVPRDSWSSPYNAFNSMKYLMYRDNLEAIARGEFPPPLMVDVDPSNVCNFNCSWCNSKTFRNEKPVMMPQGHLFKIADFLKEWGTKAVCTSGGGEPLIHSEFAEYCYRLKKNAIKNGVICNGSLLDQKNAEAIVDTVSWCGFSIDAGTGKTYAKVHGVREDVFCDVMNRIARLAELKRKRKSNVEITYKFLLHPLNAHDILDAVRLAKKIGFNTFHLRPVCVDNLYGQNQKALDFSPYIDIINLQIEEAKGYEDDDFKFYGVRHKFGEKLERKVNFERCLATPLMSTFGADGNVYLCFDVRGRPDWILCRHEPDPHEILKIWGSEKHKKIIESINPKCCPRCTFGPLNEIMDQVIIKDRMFKDFL